MNIHILNFRFLVSYSPYFSLICYLSYLFYRHIVPFPKYNRIQQNLYNTFYFSIHTYIYNIILRLPYIQIIIQMQQQVQTAIKNIVQQIYQKPKQTQKKITLPNNQLSLGELASVLSVLAKQYNTTLPNLLSKLDKVSGDLNELDKYFKGDNRVQWTKEQDELLNKNENLLKRWKGQQIVEKRKRYLGL